MQLSSRAERSLRYAVTAAGEKCAPRTRWSKPQLQAGSFRRPCRTGLCAQTCPHPNRPPLRVQDNFNVRMDREKELLAKVAAKKAAKEAAAKEGR